MALIPGDKLGPYEIVGLLVAGGMVEVYRARHDLSGFDRAGPSARPWQLALTRHFGCFQLLTGDSRQVFLNGFRHAHLPFFRTVVTGALQPHYTMRIHNPVLGDFENFQGIGDVAISWQHY
jgi:hypothetical protein